MKASTGIKNNARQRNEIVLSKRANRANSQVGAVKLCAFHRVRQFGLGWIFCAGSALGGTYD
jgi:hypothetical protein